MHNTSLDPRKLIETADRLALRIKERFPESGLSRVALDLANVARRAGVVAVRQRFPNYLLRALGVLTLLSILLAAIYVGYGLRDAVHMSDASDMAQGLEALINIVVFGGIAIYFVFSLETRIKRSRALKLLALLRSLAHVIDMHQLAKDPDRLNDPLPPTDHSPPRLQLTPQLLTRYLDYCSELLAILSKLAAIQVQRFDDPVTLDAVNDLEDLASGLSRKIWQKIMMIDRLTDSPPGKSPN